MLEIAKLLVRLHGTTGDGFGRYVPIDLFNDVMTTLERLEAGTLTEEEIHNLCHNLPATVPVTEFAKGCQRHMLKLYGTCPLEISE